MNFAPCLLLAVGLATLIGCSTKDSKFSSKQPGATSPVDSATNTRTSTDAVPPKVVVAETNESTAETPVSVIDNVEEGTVPDDTEENVSQGHRIRCSVGGEMRQARKKL